MTKPICPTAQALAVPVFRRFIEGKYTVNPDSGCWEWNASLDRNGYAKANVGLGGRRRGTTAHRAAWIVHRGPIPPLLQIDHLCRNKRCINPEHLEPVSARENTRRKSTVNLPLGERQGCSKHGTSNGYWTNPTRGRPRWSCNPCMKRRRAERKKHLRAEEACIMKIRDLCEMADGAVDPLDIIKILNEVA